MQVVQRRKRLLPKGLPDEMIKKGLEGTENPTANQVRPDENNGALLEHRGPTKGHELRKSSQINIEGQQNKTGRSGAGGSS